MEAVPSVKNRESVNRCQIVRMYTFRDRGRGLSARLITRGKGVPPRQRGRSAQWFEVLLDTARAPARRTPVVRRGGGLASSMPQTRRPAVASTTLVSQSAPHCQSTVLTRPPPSVMVAVLCCSSTTSGTLQVLLSSASKTCVSTRPSGQMCTSSVL